MTGLYIKKCGLKHGISVMPSRLVYWRLILAIVIVFSVCGFSESEAVKYNMQAATGTDLNGFTTNYGTCGDTTPTSEVIVPMNQSGTNACTAGRVTLTTAPGTSLLLVISDATYAQDMTITGIDVSGSLRDYQEATNPGTTVGVQYQLGYVSGGVFTALGTADEARDYSTNTNWTTDLSAISGTAPANSRLAIRVLKQNPDATSYRFYFTATSLVLNVTEASAATPGITVTPISGLTTTEAGATAQFTIVLDSAPTANVTNNLSSSDTTEGTVSPSSVTFTTGNWSTPQTVTVTGVDDALVDGNVAYTIVTAAATSADANYNGFNAADISVTNTDNEPPPPHVPAGNVGLFITLFIGISLYGALKNCRREA